MIEMEFIIFTVIVVNVFAAYIAFWEKRND